MSLADIFVSVHIVIIGTALCYGIWRLAEWQYNEGLKKVVIAKQNKNQNNLLPKQYENKSVRLSEDLDKYL